MKAVLSRVTFENEINFTVPENMEILEAQYKKMYLPGFEDATPEDREYVMDIIKKNIDEIDPRSFTTRTFSKMMAGLV